MVRGTSTITVHFNDNNRFALLFERTDSDYDDEDKADTIRGEYIQQADTFILKADPPYNPYAIQYKKAMDVEKGKIRLKITDFSEYDDHRILLNNELDMSKSMPIDSLYRNLETADVDNQLITMHLNKTDSIYIINPKYLRYDIFAYALPADANEIIIQNLEKRGRNFPAVLKAYQGENANEMLLSDNTKKGSIGVFYVGSDINLALMGKESFISLPDYAYLPYSKSFDIIRDEEDYDVAVVEEPIEDITEAEVIGISVINAYSSYKEAQKASQSEKKYLLLYYQPKESDSCEEYPISHLLADGSDRNDKDAEFNNYFVYYEVQEKEIKLFDKYNVKSFPATVILASDGNVVYTSEEECLYDLFNSYFSYSPEFVSCLLDRHYLNTYFLPKMAKEKTLSKKSLEEYFTLLSTDKSGAYHDEDNSYFPGYSISNYISNEGDSGLNLDVDLMQTETYLNMLVNNYYMKEKPDMTSINYVKNALLFFNNENSDDEAYVYPICDENDKLTSAYYYLAKVYENSKDVAIQNDVFHFILNSKVRTRNNYDDNALEKVKVYSALMEATPSASLLETPVLILFMQYGSLNSENMTSFMTNAVSTYLDTFVTGNIEQNIRTTFDKLYTNHKDNLIYILKGIGYSSENEEYDDSENVAVADDGSDIENSKETWQKLYTSMIINQLNTVAWFNYQFVSSESQDVLKKSLSWSEASLKLQPENPYYLDTYAHLLYRTGKREEAVQWQQKAIDNISQVEGDEARQTMKNALLRMKNDTMW